MGCKKGGGGGEEGESSKYDHEIMGMGWDGLPSTDFTLSLPSVPSRYTHIITPLPYPTLVPKVQ